MTIGALVIGEFCMPFIVAALVLEAPTFIGFRVEYLGGFRVWPYTIKPYRVYTIREGLCRMGLRLRVCSSLD